MNNLSHGAALGGGVVVFGVVDPEKLCLALSRRDLKADILESLLLYHKEVITALLL